MVWFLIPACAYDTDKEVVAAAAAVSLPLWQVSPRDTLSRSVATRGVSCQERKASCQICGTKFGIMTPRHHCRFCGLCCCDSCSQHRRVCSGQGRNSVRKLMCLCCIHVCVSVYFQDRKRSGVAQVRVYVCVCACVRACIHRVRINTSACASLSLSLSLSLSVCVCV